MGIRASERAFGSEISAPSVKATGTTGAPLSGRFVGVTASGSPTSGTYSVGDFCISQNGQMFVCVVAGTPGTWVTPVDTRSLVSTGEETLDRRLAVSNTATTMSTGILRMIFFTARKTETITQVQVVSGATAAGATPSLVRIGLWLLDGSDGGTLVASTVNDTSLLASANTIYTRSLSSSYAKVAGSRYAFGLLVVTAATAPTVLSGSPPVTPVLDVSPKLSGVITGLSDLPNTFTSAGSPATSGRMYGVMLP